MVIEQAPAPPTSAARRWTVWPLRITLTIYAAMAVGQPILMGAYLDGNFAFLAIHRLVGALLAPVAILVGVAALLHIWLGRVRFELLATTVVLFGASGLQIGFGYAHRLGLHIPLGVFLVASGVGLAIYSWTPRARQTRPIRPTRANRPTQDVCPTRADPT